VPYAQECSKCEAGKSSNIIGATSCSDGKAGGYSLKGASACSDCAAGKWSIDIAAEAESTCSACNTSMTSSPGSTSCYASCDFLEVQVGNTCEPCAVGAVCDSDDIQVETMVLLEGYWRTSNSSNDVLKCAN